MAETLANNSSMYPSATRKHSPQGQGSTHKNCAKSQNSNFSTINQMSHIQLFFHQCLPSFYLQLVNDQISHPSFLNPESQTNIYQLTANLILLSQKCIKQSNPQHSEGCIAQYWLMSYDNLRNASLQVEQSDNSVIRWLKSQLKYVHVQMIQILIRMLLIYYESSKTQEVSKSIKTNIQEISHIYPALKIQVSFMHPDINLTHWFDRILYTISQQGQLNNIFKESLQIISETCGFIGQIEKIFFKYSQKFQVHTQFKTPLPKEEKPVQCSIPPKKIQNSIKDYKASERASSVSCERKSSFDQFEFFRNKKKKIVKERLKYNNGDACKTPFRDREKSHLNSPTTEKTGIYTYSDTTQHNASSLLYQRLQTKKRSTDRTLYSGLTKFYQPKKASIVDPENYIELITAPSFQEDASLLEELAKRSGRKSSKVANTQQQENHDFFYVPETPKRDEWLKLQKNSVMQEGLVPPALRL